MRELDVMWNNGFRHIFNCCWREIVKPLQCFIHFLPLTYLIEERQLKFLNKLLFSDNMQTLACTYGVQFEILVLA